MGYYPHVAVVIRTLGANLEERALALRELTGIDVKPRTIKKYMTGNISAQVIARIYHADVDVFRDALRQDAELTVTKRVPNDTTTM